MAGAGYKLFNTGDVLTAAQVNTYLMEQTVMVFADAAARTAALTGVVSEGMLSYLKSTKQVEVYNGSAWVASDDPNAIQNTIVDAKGDLIAATANDTPARIAVGNNGETLVADSSTTTGLRWQPVNGQNYLIGGGFDIWQRGTSFTGLLGNAYGADRWMFNNTTGRTYSRQSAGLDGFQYCLRVQRDSGQTGTTSPTVIYSNETVNSIPLQGKTVTLSYYARAGANYSSASNALSVSWNTGTGTDQNVYTAGYTGSVSVVNTSVTLTTSWQRFSHTFSVASNATEIGGTWAYTPSGTAGAADYFEMTGVQLEIGSVATPFKRAGGTLAGELAACQRYYWKTYLQGTAPATNTSTAIMHFSGGSDGSGNILSTVFYPVTMRTAPTITVYRIDGTSGSWGYERSGATGNGTVSIDLTGDRQTRFYTAVGANWVVANHYGHMIASAEL